MANKLFDQVGGTIKVTLKGKHQEKIINMASSRGVYIWDIKKNGDDLNFKVRTSGLNALQSISAENGYDLDIKERQGLPFYHNLLRRRLGFFTGALIFVLALYVMSSFVWFVEVSGNKKVETGKIMLTAAKHGVYQGAAKWNFSRLEVEEAMLRDIDELSYVRLDIRGVKARIQVVEKILPKTDISDPCHIVATRDGVIEEVLTLEGQAGVKPGDVVKKGDILISGVVFPEKSSYIVSSEEEEKEEQKQEEPYTVRARGQVKARVWYEGYGECRLHEEKLVLSGRKSSKIYIETPWKTFWVKGQREKSYPFYTQKVKKRIAKSPLGEFGFFKVELEEKIKKTRDFNEKEAVAVAREQAMQRLTRKMGKNPKIGESRVDILSSPSDPILRARISVETIEDIATAQPINISPNSN